MKFDWTEHASMFGANAMWGLMSPISKVIKAVDIVLISGGRIWSYRVKQGAMGQSSRHESRCSVLATCMIMGLNRLKIEGL